MALKDFLGEDVRIIDERTGLDDGAVSRILHGDQETTVVFNDLNGMKAAGNVFSTREKIAAALGIGPDEIIDRLAEAIDKPAGTTEVGEPLFRSRTIETDLTRLPIPKYYPEDRGRYITSGVIIAESGGRRNVSFHRMMVVDAGRLAVRLVPRHLFTMHREAEERGEELRISICVGLPPEVLLAAAVVVDYGVDELTIASALSRACRGHPLEVGRCDNGLLVPADCDYVMEGRITFDRVEEGPFVDITGTYDAVRMEPVIEIERIWTAPDPCFHLLLPGGYDHFLLMGLPREPMILKTVRQAVPRVRAVRLTEGGCCWLNGVVSITKNKEGDGVNAILAAFTGHPSMKNVIIVDDDIDIFDDREVEWAVATRMQGDRILVIPGAAGSSLDPSTSLDPGASSTTCKVGYDATLPLGTDMFMFEKARLG